MTYLPDLFPNILWSRHKSYFITYLRPTKFWIAVYCWTCVTGRTHAYFVDTWASDTEWVWVTPSIAVWWYSTLNFELWTWWTAQRPTLFRIATYTWSVIMWKRVLGGQQANACVLLVYSYMMYHHPSYDNHLPMTTIFGGLQNTPYSSVNCTNGLICDSPE